MTKHMPVDIMVSLRVGHVTFEVSWRTSLINCIGFGFSIYIKNFKLASKHVVVFSIIRLNAV